MRYGQKIWWMFTVFKKITTVKGELPLTLPQNTYLHFQHTHPLSEVVVEVLFGECVVLPLLSQCPE